MYCRARRRDVGDEGKNACPLQALSGIYMKLRRTIGKRIGHADA